MSRNDQIDIACIFHAETERAMLISEDGEEDDAIWLPKSQMSAYDTGADRGEVITITIPEWLAIDKGLI